MGNRSDFNVVLTNCSNAHAYECVLTKGNENQLNIYFLHHIAEHHSITLSNIIDQFKVSLSPSFFQHDYVTSTQ